MTNTTKEYPAFGLRGLLSDPRGKRLVASGLVALAAIAAGGVSADFLARSGTTPEELLKIASLQLKRIVSPGASVPRLAEELIRQPGEGKDENASSGADPKVAHNRGPVDPLDIGEEILVPIQAFWSGQGFGFTDGTLSFDEQSPDGLSLHFGNFGLPQRVRTELPSNALTLASWTGISALGIVARSVQTVPSNPPTPSSPLAESADLATEAGALSGAHPEGEKPPEGAGRKTFLAAIKDLKNQGGDGESGNKGGDESGNKGGDESGNKGGDESGNKGGDGGSGSVDDEVVDDIAIDEEEVAKINDSLVEGNTDMMETTDGTTDGTTDQRIVIAARDVPAPGPLLLLASGLLLLGAFNGRGRAFSIAASPVARAAQDLS